MTAQRVKSRQRAPVRLASKPAKTPRGMGARALDGVRDPVELAKLTLQAICRDEKSPSAARAQSARTLLELAGALRVGAPNIERSASEMSSEELDARLAALDAPDTPDTPV